MTGESHRGKRGVEDRGDCLPGASITSYRDKQQETLGGGKGGGSGVQNRICGSQGTVQQPGDSSAMGDCGAESAIP